MATPRPPVCVLCGGGIGLSLECDERPGLLSLADEHDLNVLDALEHLHDPVPEECEDCLVAADGAHHIGCRRATCSTHMNSRLVCGCDRDYLAAIAEAERPYWPQLAWRWLRWLLRRPPRFKPGMEILR